MADDMTWVKKDALIVAQHAQKVAAQLIIHTDRENTLTGSIKLAIAVNETAEKLAKGVYSIADKLVANPAPVLPLPNPEQQKILELIAADMGVNVDDKLKEQVLKWAKDTHGVRQYPASPASVKAFIERK